MCLPLKTGVDADPLASGRVQCRFFTRKFRLLKKKVTLLSETGEAAVNQFMNFLALSMSELRHLTMRESTNDPTSIHALDINEAGLEIATHGQLAARASDS